jgi:hypothetical protein
VRARMGEQRRLEYEKKGSWYQMSLTFDPSLSGEVVELVGLVPWSHDRGL